MIPYQNDKYDAAFKKIDGLKYYPWVGIDYGKMSRVMIVAESVYNWGKEDDTDRRKEETTSALNNWDFAQRVVYNNGLYFLKEHGHDNIKNSPTFRNLECAIYGKERAAISDSERERLWKQVSLHELIQQPMSGPDKRPKDNEYRQSAEILAKIAGLLQPQNILMLGTDWNNVKYAKSRMNLKNMGDENKIGRCRPKRFTVNIKDHCCTIIMIKHPGKFFSWRKWHPYIKSCLADWHIYNT